MASQPVRHGDWKPSHNHWLVALTVTLATFMEVLDSSIANVALPHMAGSLGASYNEATWVLTSYLVSSAIVLPVSGWLGTVIGRKRFYMLCVAVFTACSVLCGLANSLPLLIIARVLQGAGGGGLQPSEQAILADTFPADKRGMAFALYGMAVVAAPAIGPTLGGWITDNYNWHWIFFINLPVGLISLFMTQRVVEDPPWLKREKSAGIRIDYIGLALIVIGVGCFQVVLDKGQEDDWFASSFITTMFCIGIPVLIAFFLWEWYNDDPIVDVRLLKNRNFGTAVFFSFVLGIVLFGTTVIIPQFLQVSLGYTAERAGMALSPGGIALMMMMPIAGVITQSKKIDPRILVACGFSGLAATLFMMTTVYPGVDFRTMVIFRVVQVLPMPFVFIPISTLNYIGVPREKSNQVSGLSNFSRNIGGSIGTSFLSIFQSRQNQTHQNALIAHVTHANTNFEAMLASFKNLFVSQGFDAVTASQKALAQVYLMVQSHANALSFKNSFFVLGIVVIFLIPLPFIMRRPPRGQAAMGGIH